LDSAYVFFFMLPCVCCVVLLGGDVPAKARFISCTSMIMEIECTVPDVTHQSMCGWLQMVKR